VGEVGVPQPVRIDQGRIAKYLIEKAEAEGLLQPGDTIVEASSGNTGNAMSMVAALARDSIR